MRRSNIAHKEVQQNQQQQKSINYNRFKPLQETVNNENDIDNDHSDDEVIVEKSTKVHVPPITVIKSNIDAIHNICKELTITDYAIKKISIGIKVFCNYMIDHDELKFLTNKNLEFFTHATKNEKPYKAVLTGLDSLDATYIKKRLTEKGLNCIDVKKVEKKLSYNENIFIYIVYFERQSITLNELRHKHSVFDYVKVKWDFQRPNQARITQCYNCQMFGHGSSRCRVKTADCKEPVNKCINCNGEHKALSKDCPARKNYVEIKQRIQGKNHRSNKFSAQPNMNTFANYNNHFPNNSHQQASCSNPTWNAQCGELPSYNYNDNTNNSYNNNLFSIEQLKNITFELITSLNNCKTKADQLNVITSIAFKFLS